MFGDGFASNHIHSCMIPCAILLGRRWVGLRPEGGAQTEEEHAYALPKAA